MVPAINVIGLDVALHPATEKRPEKEIFGPGRGIFSIFADGTAGPGIRRAVPSEQKNSLQP